MTIRVLHIFTPNYKKRFGGPIFDWKFAFSNWNDPSIEHFVLDYDQKSLVEAKVAFSFDIAADQILSTRRQRTLWIIALIHELRKFQGQYDLIHFHVLWWGGLIAAAWAKIKKIPTLYQSVLENSDTPSGVINQAQGQIKFRLLKNFSAILAISPSLAEDYLHHGFSQDKVFTLMNSVDTKLFFPVSSLKEKKNLREKHALPLEGTILLFTGSLISRKGVDILLDSFIKLAQIDLSLYLLLVGPRSINENPSIDEEFVANLETQISSFGLKERVIFTGLISDRNQLAIYYRCADIFVFPSRNEGLPNVVLEAMASGLPVVVSDLPGLRNVVLPNINGLVVPIGEVEPLINLIEILINDPDMASKLASNANATIFQNHSFSSWQSQLSAIYQTLMHTYDGVFPSQNDFVDRNR